MSKPGVSNRRLFCAGLLCVATFGNAQALDEDANHHVDLAVDNAWQPHMPAVIESRAGYFTLRNNGADRMTIVGVSSPNFESVAIHRSVLMRNSVAMEPVSRLHVAPGETVHFAPHGLHLMLHKAKFVTAVGEQYPVVLQFSDGHTQAFSMQVVAPDCDRCGVGQAHDHAH